MAAPQGGGGGGQQDTGTGILWTIAAIFAAIGIIWYTLKNYIITFFFKIKLAEISVVSLFTNKLDPVRDVIQNTDPSKLTFNDLVHVGTAVGEYLAIPFAIIICALAVIVFLGNSTRVFKRIYSMGDMIKLEKDNWPQITPIVNQNLIKQDIDKGPWAMAMTPMQFCKKYKLLEEHRRTLQEGFTKKERNRIEVTLRRGLANKIFAIQLGPMWQGTQKLPPHIKALFAAFAARINSDSNSSRDLLAKISKSSASRYDFSGADALCKKYENTKLVQEITNSHAYVFTVMASMLQGARSDGVQGTADFLWVKPVDRRLWYVLNTVGRQTPFVEIAGVFAHWIAERELGRKILVPIVEEATNALELSLKEVVYKPDET